MHMIDRINWIRWLTTYESCLSWVHLLRVTSFLPFWIMKGFNNLFHISLFSSGIDFKMKTISLGGKTIKVQIWWLLSLDSTKNKLK